MVLKAAFILWCALLNAQDSQKLAAGKFLVAKQALGDPNFRETVILLVNYDDKGAMGLVINDRSTIPLSKLFGEGKNGKGRTDPFYIGGPVQQTTAQALLRVKEKPEDATLVFADVYITGDRALIEKSIEAGAGQDAFRLYLGYSGWGPGQLDREFELGAWYVVRGDADVVFDANPSSVWDRMTRRAQTHYARNSEEKTVNSRR